MKTLTASFNRYLAFTAWTPWLKQLVLSLLVISSTSLHSESTVASQAPDIYRKVDVVVFKAGFRGDGKWRAKHRIYRFLSAKLANHFDRKFLDLPNAPKVRSAYDPQSVTDVVEGSLIIVAEIALRESRSGVTMAYSVYGLRRTKGRAVWKGMRFDEKFNQFDFGVLELQTRLADGSSKFRVFDAMVKIVDKAFINPYMKWKRLQPKL